LGPPREVLDQSNALPEWIKGLWHLSVAKAELDRVHGAVELIDRAVLDWQANRGRMIAAGLAEPDWRYVQGRMKLWQGFAYHLRNRNVLDQVAAWNLMTQAAQELEQWHDDLGIPRNFESSPEYAELHWRRGLYLLEGGDLESSQRCFARIMDVDVFNVLPMGQTKQLLGKALTYQKEALSAEEHKYGGSLARRMHEAAVSLAEAALASTVNTFQVDVITDILLLLARSFEGLGRTEDAVDYYRRASEGLRSIHGNVVRADKIMEKALMLGRGSQSEETDQL
jgi:tetratricopeptide (TPR) repeat protein